jgi:hypothetical protein
MWSSKPVSKITGSEEEILLEIDIQAKDKGLWYNIQQKKKRMGKNYRPAKPGSPDRPSQESLKKAQAADYLNEEYDWDGETEFDQNELLKIDASLSQADEVETMDNEDMEAHDKDALVLSRLSGLDVVSSTQALTAAINSFNRSVIDSIENEREPIIGNSR